MKVTKQCPLLLLVNVGCRQVGILESEEGEVMGCRMSWVRGRRNTSRSGCGFVWGRLHYGYIFIKLGGM